MNRIRESNYDLLRIISAIAVITIHVSSHYIGGIVSPDNFGDFYLEHILTTCAYNVLSRFAVPCFIMLSGAFILADDRNADYQYFYRKTFRNVGIPTLVFSILYFSYFMVLKVLKMFIKGMEMDEFLNPIKGFIIGKPCYHMWYLYMMIGVYLLVPVIIAFKKQVGEQKFEKIAWIFLALASVSFWTSKHILMWDIGYSFYFVGYLMVGYILRKKALFKQDNRKGFMLLSAGILVEVFIIYLRYQQALNRISDDELKYTLIAPLSPLIVIASVLIFAGISQLSIHKNLSWLSSYTFLIYLFHAGIWDFMRKTVIKYSALSWDNRVVIPVSIIIVFFLSLGCAVIYQSIWKLLEQKWAVSDRFCRLFDGVCKKIM